MDKLLDSPWLLRLTALFLAILLFYTVKDLEKVNKNTTVPEMEVIRDIPVEVYYDDENLIVSGVPATVTMSVEGPSNIVKTAKLFKDFELFIDLTSLPLGEHEVEIEHENVSEKLQTRIEPAKIKVLIEEKVTETFRVEPEFNERLLAEGYNVAKMEAHPKTIEVTGAKSVIESINFVKATVSANPDVKESFEQDATVRVLDKDLNKLEVAIIPEMVKVSVEIQENAKEVPIVINEIGSPPAGVIINSITPEFDKITLSGPNRILNELDSFPVDVDLSKVKESGTIEVKLKKPDDIFQLSFTTLKIEVEVAEEEVIEDVDEGVDRGQGEETDETARVEDVLIVVKGLDEQFKSTFIQPANGTITLLVKGKPNQINQLKKSDFTVIVDATSVDRVGEYEYPIDVNGPPQVEWELSLTEATLKIELV